ncbi:MAG TPA: DNA gyrase/topoisomerase IV subunit A [Cyclobacteriaceae bacterium]|nr:DNA gyrase/topoisomerase IV subunit A [Cyclobacteriaceae bacterium]HMV10369.1 DNA gyrase/topoisomerase IV subunit A [Cyclobacteriaceae bacterium]HMV89276.1 DNA gyrase/topoisomerase IV subunit A [Cyclobacteriaceae bacterium]HMX00394.1 DNA gyrase/topoisomerase IV subunit A [Cyclobacteriaceae bacterium]HMX49607.1 DNA gyrase/topoisomerase IV subunit A [Cyclobacteriaceae bacterium]
MSKKKIERPVKKQKNENGDVVHSVAIDGLYETWFLDYASYVILERAVPRIEDGFKPVQRRIMHSLKEMDDGRFNKVANVIGNTMQYHPHGDASIGEAIVNIGQKDLLIETQGNWGDVRTGDSAAAPRYIEARLSKFALDVAYNAQTTEWQLSYDGRKKEPVTLPVKFPLLLAQGVEGIAVGLSTKILPHNFNELIKASIDVLKGKKPKIYPDFPTGGIADFSEYNQGLRGGKIKVRAKIDITDKKMLTIREIPFSTTTTSLMESIVKASEKGQIKVKQVVDNTAKDVEIQIHLQPGQSPEIALDALYAFTDCEISISPNSCVIVEEKPQFLPVGEILRYNTEQTVQLLKQELEIKKAELMEKILFSSLEKIFIENRIYRDIEEAESWEEVITTIDKGLKPHKKKFYREITRDDIIRLTEIKIKRISRYDSFKADELMRDLEKELKDTLHHLKHLTEYAISYYQGLLDKYGKGRERKTEIKSFQSVTATEVIAINQKLYVNRKDGFAGYGLKRDEYICDCSDLDDIIAIRRDGKAFISKIKEKVFMGKDILYIGVWKKGDDRMVYNVIYSDGKSGKGFVKRFAMPGVIRDKEYDLTQGHPNSMIHYVSGNPNGEAEMVEVKLSQSSTARKKVFEFDFSELEIKGRGSRGNTLTKYPIRKVDFLQAGTSTLSKLDLWYDADAGRLNKDKRGIYVGKFDGDDQLITFMRNGSYRISGYDLTTRFDPEKTLLVEKFNPKKPISAVYIDGETKQYMVKRFLIETSTADKEFGFISESIGSRLVVVTTSDTPEVEMDLVKGASKEKVKEVVNLEDIIDVKGWKALGNRLSQHKVTGVKLTQEPEETGLEEGDDDNELIETTETGKGSQSSKKKEQQPPVSEEGQAALFAEPEKPKGQVQKAAQPKPKVKAEQQDLFGAEKPKQEKPVQKEKSEKVIVKPKVDKPKPGDTAFDVGQTIELEL